MKLSPHVKDHPLAFSLAIAAAILGALLIVTPVLAATSPSLAVLPPLGVVIWGLWFFLGGLMSAIGMNRMQPRLEATGMMLQSSAYLTTLVSTLVVFPNPLSIIFLGALTIGTYFRAVILRNR